MRYLHSPSSATVCFSKFFLITFFLLLTSACGGGQYVENYDGDNANVINAVNIQNKHQFSALSENRDMQPVTIEVVNNTAYMSGIMDSTIFLLIQNLITNHPDVDTLVMRKVMGTIDFQSTLKAGRLIREACLTTVVPYFGKIASGGVHLFLAGCDRVIENGGQLGVHTWKFTQYDDSGNLTQSWTAGDLPESDPRHTPYLDYHSDLAIPESLYWMIADIPFDQVHYLNKRQIEKYNISTHETRHWGAPYQLAISDSDAQINWDSARFYVSKNVATLHGNISERTSFDLDNMLTDHPEVNTIRLGYVDDASNANDKYRVQLGLTIRNYCLATEITGSTSVTFDTIQIFLAGCQRKLSVGGQIQKPSTEYFSKELSVDSADYYDQMGVALSFYDYLSTRSDSTINHVDYDTFIQFGLITSDS